MSWLYKVNSTKILFIYFLFNLLLEGETRMYGVIFGGDLEFKLNLIKISTWRASDNAPILRFDWHSLTKCCMSRSKSLMKSALNQQESCPIPDYVYSSNASGIWGWRKIFLDSSTQPISKSWFARYRWYPQHGQSWWQLWDSILEQWSMTVGACDSSVSMSLRFCILFRWVGKMWQRP